MRRIHYFKLGQSSFYLTRLIGSFIVIAAVLMFFSASANMFDSWTALKEFPSCIASISPSNPELAQLQYMDCKQSLKEITGLQVLGGQSRISSRQFWSALLTPIASLFFWAAVLITGLAFYRSGEVVIPLEQAVVEIEEKKKKKAGK